MASRSSAESGAGGLQALRKRAEALLSQRHASEPVAGIAASEQLRELLHELDVYSVELELQNEELRRARDETERARDRYYDLYHTAPVAYLTFNHHGIIREANQAASRLLALPRDKLAGRGILQFIAPEDHGRFATAMRDLKALEPARGFETRLRLSDGERKFVQVDISREGGVEGRDDDLRLVLTDISECKLLEEQRNMFFSIASHELRTPLTNINMALDMLSDSVAALLKPEARDLLEVARRGAKRLRRLMEDILQLRNIRSGALPMPVKPVSLASLVQEAVEANRPFAHEFGITLELDLGTGDARVNANEGRLLQVLNNLLSNAIKHAPQGDSVQILLVRERGLVRLSVMDRGRGVPPELGRRIFEPFTQAAPSLEDERHRGSSGLGLSISCAIIKQHGGRLDFDSIPGERTTFYFELPTL